MSNPIPNPVGAPGAQPPAQGGTVPQQINQPAPEVDQSVGQAPSDDSGASAVEVETDEQIQQRLAAGKFLLDAEALTYFYGVYYEAAAELMRAEVYAEDVIVESGQNPGGLIEGIAKAEQRCQAEARALSYRLTKVGNDLRQLLNGLAETARQAYETDAEASDAIKKTVK